MSIIQESSQLKKSDPNFSITFSVKPFRLYPFFVRQNSVSGFFGKNSRRNSAPWTEASTCWCSGGRYRFERNLRDRDFEDFGPGLGEVRYLWHGPKKKHPPGLVGPGCFPNRCRFFFNTWHPQKFALLYLVVFFLMNQGLNLRDS